MGIRSVLESKTGVLSRTLWERGDIKQKHGLIYQYKIIVLNGLNAMEKAH